MAKYEICKLTMPIFTLFADNLLITDLLILDYKLRQYRCYRLHTCCSNLFGNNDNADLDN
jgi:hypothetical protein